MNFCGSMRSYCPKAVLVCILALLTLACVGCGGSGNVNANGNGSSSTPPPTQPSNSTINGFWYINMGTSQAGRHINPNPGPTEIGISLVQNGSVLTTDKPVYSINTACEGPGSIWSTAGGWNSAMASFVFESGALVGHTVTFTLNETKDVNDPTGAAHGEVMLTGNWNADGTMSGTLIDGCNANASSDWTASRTAGSITSIRAVIIGLNNIPRSNPLSIVDIHMPSDGA